MPLLTDLPKKPSSVSPSARLLSDAVLYPHLLIRLYKDVYKRQPLDKAYFTNNDEIINYLIANGAKTYEEIKGE